MFDLASSVGIDKLEFRVYSEEEIEKLSVANIVTDEARNSLGHFNKGGLYDLRLGPLTFSDQCETCFNRMSRCMGHCGHIDLPLPVFNPFFLEHTRKLLDITCINCGMIQVSSAAILQAETEHNLLSAGYTHEVYKAAEAVARIAHELDGGVRITCDNQETTAKKKSEAAELLKLIRVEKALKNLEEPLLKDVSTDVLQTSTNRDIFDKVRSQMKKCIKIYERSCKACKFPLVRVQYRNSQMVLKFRNPPYVNKVVSGQVEVENKLNINLASETTVLTALQAKNILRESWKNNSKALLILFPIFKKCNFTIPTDMFFMTKMLVIPSMYRPLRSCGEKKLEHESCVLLKSILRMCRCLRYLSELINNEEQAQAADVRLLLGSIEGNSYHQKTDKVWQLLQGYTDNLLDANSNEQVKMTQAGIKQILEKKGGLFRSNLMGKRVNYSARSVLAPDPAIAVDEVGVPLDFALHLSYPVPVTQWNVAFLRKLVINGAHIFPGALSIKMEDGKHIDLSPLSKKARISYAKQLLTPPASSTKIKHPFKIVYRHLMDGDLVLMNRQPTLHRPSIQAHKTRVMKGVRVLRLPYANCKAYNADFDGDEMNLHFPQNELARSESQHLVTTYNSYLTPKDGTPLAGLVQDCVVAGVELSLRGSFFKREDFMQMVNVALQDHYVPITIIKPAIMKPAILWSGKQVISTILCNLIPNSKALPTFKFKTSVKPDVWETEASRSSNVNEMTESEFIMRDGQLLCGVVDKSAIGSTQYGLIHVCYDLYGGEVASKILTALNRLCMFYLQLFGHTISSKEFLTPNKVSCQRRTALNELVKATPAKVLEKVEMDEEQFRNFWESNHVKACEKNMSLVDAAYTQVLGKTTSEITTINEKGLFRPSLDNRMRLMVDSGAKGSKVNMNQMASVFGPTAMDGKRMPMSIAGKTLPSFAPYEMNPRAGGFISDRFMTGMNPQNYFFLCIVGRDSLQHTAVKTANSGYMQRCLIKHLEGIHVAGDMTVRNSDKLVLQFHYGEDGLDVLKVPFLKQPSTLDVVVDNYSRIVAKDAIEQAKDITNASKINSYKKKLKKYLSKCRKLDKSKRRSPFLSYCDDVEHSIQVPGFDKHKGRSKKALMLQKMWKSLSTEEKAAYENQVQRVQPPCLNPIINKHNSNNNLGVMTEALDTLIDDYFNQHYCQRSAHHRKYTKEDVHTTVSMKVLRSHVDPGEAVGAICAQAIGEPLTQMTLNTFHFAGRDELNVTLGVPRMVEILRTATDSISTPIMEVPFLPGVSRSAAETLKKKFTEVTLEQVIQQVNIETKTVAGWDLHCQDALFDNIKIRFTLHPTHHYKHELPVTCSDVLAFMEKYYFEKGLIKNLFSSNKKPAEIVAPMESITIHEAASTDKSSGESSVDEEEDVDDDLDDSSKHEETSENEPEDVKVVVNNKEVNGEEKGDEDEGFIDAPSITRSKKGKGCNEAEAKIRIKAVKQLNRMIVDYKFDTKEETWCELTVQFTKKGKRVDCMSTIRNTVKKAFVHRIPGIKRAFIDDNKGRLLLRTEGVNVYKLVEWANVLDINKLYTNDIQLVAKTFGIEAAQKSIIREIRAVQSAYNISVDYRHLSLLADYFTSEGVYKACSRNAMATSQSIMQQMSYESTLTFMKKAVAENIPDNMQSPSARIAMGQLATIGTNVFDVLLDVNSAKQINGYLNS